MRRASVSALLVAGLFAAAPAAADTAVSNLFTIDLRTPAPSTATVFLPSSAFRRGENAAEYRTDVRVLNLSSEAVTVRTWLYDQASTAAPEERTFRIEARNQAAFDNVLESLFGRALSEGAYGPIRFDATGPILVGASVNNVNACGSGAVSGQWLPGLPVSKALRNGVVGQVAVSASAASGYRTNLVVVNPGVAPATVTVTVRLGGGAEVATASIGPLAPNGFRQVALSEVPGMAGRTESNLWLELRADAPVFAYATVVHNVSGDPFAVVASEDVEPAP